jgi:hypothetical protein
MIRLLPDDATSLADAICGASARRTAWTEERIRVTLLLATHATCGVRKREALRQLLCTCAERTGQPLDVDAMATRAGIARRTAYDWLEALEAAGLLRRLPGWVRDGLGSRCSPRPLLHVRDSALACALLGIKSALDLGRHPARQRLAESWLVELAIAAGGGTATAFWHFRTLGGRHVPLVHIAPGGVALVTIATTALPTGLQSDRTMQRWAPHGRHVAHLAKRLRQLGVTTAVWARQVVHPGPLLLRRADWYCPSWRQFAGPSAPVATPGGTPQYTRSDAANSVLSFR